ncbi:hypothetical protein ACEPAH_2473 [Sanghuangporus vaninii]
MSMYNVEAGDNAELDVDKSGLQKGDTVEDSALQVDKERNEVRVVEEAETKMELSNFRRRLLVPLLCSAQFFDIAVSSSTIIAIPKIGDALDFKPSELQWVVGAYTLTFASFQLIGGRLTDIYHAKPIFVSGFAIVGIFSILCAVSVHPIMLIVFRAVQGIGAAFTIPSALALIVQTVPDPAEQAQALAAVGASGAVGNAVGFVLGGVLTSRISWRWVFYLMAIMILPLCAFSALALPGSSISGHADKSRQIDIPGVGVLTACLILFVYAISDGSHSGWDKPEIITALIFSVVCGVAFFFVETRVADPAVPPRTWRIPNVVPLFVYALSIYWFLYGSELQLVEIFQVKQDIFGWSPLASSLYCIPIAIGVAGGISATLSGIYGPHFPRKLLLFAGQIFMAVSVGLFALGDSPDKYWSHIFPGMIVGMIGIGITFVGVNIAVMASAPAGEEGVVGALVNTSIQLGATIGLAIMTTISTGVNNHLPPDVPASKLFEGYQDAFWSLLGFQCLMAVVSVAFVK